MFDIGDVVQLTEAGKDTASTFFEGTKASELGAGEVVGRIDGRNGEDVWAVYFDKGDHVLQLAGILFVGKPSLPFFTNEIEKV